MRFILPLHAFSFTISISPFSTTVGEGPLDGHYLSYSTVSILQWIKRPHRWAFPARVRTLLQCS
jgi:hypothetical protein